jgi:hypothetical protein
MRAICETSAFAGCRNNTFMFISMTMKLRKISIRSHTSRFGYYFPREVDIVGVEQTQRSSSILITNFGKHVPQKNLVTVSEVHMGVRSTSAQRT